MNVTQWLDIIAHFRLKQLQPLKVQRSYFSPELFFTCGTVWQLGFLFSYCSYCGNFYTGDLSIEGEKVCFFPLLEKLFVPFTCYIKLLLNS